MMGRIGLGAVMLALIGWAAVAAPIPGTDQQIGSWLVQADDDGNGKFAYCDASRDDGGATLVHIAQAASGSWQIGFTNAGWQFAVGQDVTVTLFVDQVPYPLVLRTLSATAFATTLPDTSLIDVLRQGNMLTLQLGGVYRTFSLDGSTAAINAASLCQQQRTAAPPPVAPPAAAPQAAVTPPTVPPLPAATPAPTPAPAATPATGGMPPEVAQEVANLQSNCQVMNKTPPPIGDFVTRIGLTGSGIDDWLINTAGISCAGLSGGGGGGAMMEIFIGLPDGHARKVFARYALGVEIRGSTVWLGSSGAQCGGAATVPPKSCQVPLVWNKATQRFDEGSPTNVR
jgi:hypothetical protein